MRVAIVDDDPQVRQALARLVEREGHQAEVYSDGEAALAAILRVPPEAIVLDLSMPRLNGWNALQVLQQHGLAGRTVVCSGQPDPTGFTARYGARRYLYKPVRWADLWPELQALAAEARP
ncbi:MAG: response regulator [Chloroflexi bacterium]|nr:response regulator [Chloroflexota bacterium]MBU1750413.1 response regulator [Chloroflexota bacterium]